MYTPVRLTLMTLPLLTLMLFGFAFPLLKAIGDSVTGGETFGGSYVELAEDPVFWRVLTRTIETGAAVSLICLIIGYPTAEFIAGASTKLRPVLLAMVILPFWSSVVARTYGWYGMFVKDGVIDSIAHLLGASNQMLLYSKTAVIVGMVHVLLPIFILSLYAAVRNYNSRLSLASFSLGAGRWRTLLLVKIPMLAPAILAAATSIFVISLGFFVTPALLGGSRFQLMSTLVSQQIVQRYDVPRAEAMSVVLLVATLGALALAAGLYGLLRRRLVR